MRSTDSTAPPPKLSEIGTGISKDESSRWQAKAGIPDEQFESHLAQHRDAGVPVTSNSSLFDRFSRVVNHR
ncbi:MAG TPA: hypothetical protein VES65_11310 [Solirubrobacteraceae bacterium]|nr:hypothetical protein [Solirubrobacteraceae bacterium]